MTATPDPGRTELIPEGSSMAPRIAAIGFIVVAIAFWIFAFSPWARQIFQAPDQLGDENLVLQLEDRCAAALTEMGELPSIRSAASPEDRASNLELANAALERMLVDIDGFGSTAEGDERLIGLWLGDWQIYMADRVAHVDRLRTEGDVRFLNTEADGIFIAERMSGFARVNNMRSCLPPGDL